LQKLVFDALNGIAYDDDRQIAFVQAIKRWAYSDEGTGIVISFWELT
jgi:Holliday junction resolvase RusA-like endonuclease